MIRIHTQAGMLWGVSLPVIKNRFESPLPYYKKAPGDAE